MSHSKTSPILINPCPYQIDYLILKVIIMNSFYNLIKSQCLFSMAEQNNMQPNESNNTQGEFFKQSISYSRLAEEVDKQDIDKQKGMPKPPQKAPNLLNPNQRHKNPHALLKPQQKQESRATLDGLRIQINYLSHEVEKNNEKECKNQKISNTNPNYMYSSSPSCNLPDSKSLKVTNLVSIPETETEHKRSDEEPNEQRTITESQQNSKQKASLYTFKNNIQSLALQKDHFQNNKNINQSQPQNENKKLDDSVEIVDQGLLYPDTGLVRPVNHQPEPVVRRQEGRILGPLGEGLQIGHIKPQQQNPIKTSKTTASKILAKKEDFTNVLVQTVQKVQAALMTMSVKSQGSPVANHQYIRYFYDDRHYIRLKQRQKKNLDMKTDDRPSFLKQSKSLSRVKKSSEISSQRQLPILSKDLQKIIKSSVWIKLLSSRANSNEQLNNCLISIGKLVNISTSYTVINLNPFLVIYSSNEMLQISYSKKIFLGQYKQYKGNFIRHGKGIEIDPLRSIYRGNFKEGMKEGSGKILILDSYTYEGQWKGGVMQGKGVLNTKGKSTYSGQFTNGKKHGFGMQELNSGDKYEGQFQNNAFHGKGVYSWKSGARYEGDFMNGQMHGQGKWTSERGDIYIGSFVNGKKEGHGVYSWKNGKKYEGQFKNGSRKNVIQNKFSTKKEVCDVSFEKSSLSPKRFKIYF